MDRWSVITHWWRLTYWVSVWNLYSVPRICTDCYELCSGAQSCPTLCNPKDLSLPGSSSHGILLARILKHVAISSSRGSSQPRDGACISCVSCIGMQVLSLCATRKPYCIHLALLCQCQFLQLWRIFQVWGEKMSKWTHESNFVPFPKPFKTFIRMRWIGKETKVTYFSELGWMST